MFARIAVAASLVASTLMPLAARAELEPCELLTSSVVAVQPHRVDQHFGKIVVQRLDGASLFLQAKPGLSAEWLQRSLATHITQMAHASMAHCPLQAKNVRVDVRAAGSGYWVDVTAKDSKQAQFVLEQATSLLHHSAG